MRIEDRFNRLKKEKKKAFIAYIPFGFPKVKYTKDIILALQDAGVDLIELGIPFSDPLADGPIIQAATAKALSMGADTDKLFSMLNQLKGKLNIPLVLMTYYNPVFRYGMDRFFRKMRQADVSGIMIVDLPVEESEEYIKMAKSFDLESVFFITPTTSKQRAKRIVKASKGFIYYISVTGITGPRDLVYSPLASYVKYLRTITRLPICLGFGVHTKRQVKEIGSFSDGVIIGSSIVRFIEDNHSRKDFLKRLKKYIKSLKP